MDVSSNFFVADNIGSYNGKKLAEKKKNCTVRFEVISRVGPVPLKSYGPKLSGFRIFGVVLYKEIRWKLTGTVSDIQPSPSNHSP